MYFDPQEAQQLLIDRLWEKNAIGATQRSLFHDLRRAGNAAVHESKGAHSDALHQLRMARELAVWFQRTFGNNKKFDPGPFIPLPEPKRADGALNAELQRLQGLVDAQSKEREQAVREAEAARQAAEAALAERLSAEQRAAKAQEDAAIWEALANEQAETHLNATHTELQKSAALVELNKKRGGRRSGLPRDASAVDPVLGAERRSTGGRLVSAGALDHGGTTSLRSSSRCAASATRSEAPVPNERGLTPRRATAYAERGAHPRLRAAARQRARSPTVNLSPNAVQNREQCHCNAAGLQLA